MGRIVGYFFGPDGSGNALIDQPDYQVWKDNFGNTLNGPPGNDPFIEFAVANEAPQVTNITVSGVSTTPVVAADALNNGVAVDDNATGTGYLMYSEESVHTRFGNVHASNSDYIVGVRDNGGQWQYNTNTAWVNFTPVSTDTLLASVDFSADNVDPLVGTSGMENGIVKGYYSGDLVFTPNLWGGNTNEGEFGISGTTFYANSQNAPYSFADAMADPNWIAGDQLRTVPVGGADTISITFSEDVFVDAGDLTLIGLRTQNEPYVADPSDFSYDIMTMTATWKLTGWTLGDHYVISLPDSILDTEGLALDGEWTNPDSISSTNSGVSNLATGSGDGTAGGGFQFVTTLLPGDANLNGVVDIIDLGILGLNYGNSINQQFSGADFNGDGAVDLIDFDLIGGNYDLDLQTLLIAGDLNGNYAVNGTDRATLVANQGMSNPTALDGDLDSDGDVDSDDLTLFDTIDLAFSDFGLDLLVA